jgi:lipopolysaccharide transport system ATP-binding protein
MASITLNNAGLVFRVRQHRRMTLKETIVRRLTGRTVNPILDVHALDGVNLSLREGERLGIIGHNGAGKSTILRLLAGVYPPTTGERIVEGQISSLFELGLGFEPDASGWENIAFRGYLQGETPSSIRTKMKSIADFSELGDFLNTPVRYYSSGMVVRLAFSIATAINPEILLIDEVLAAGDLAFQQKARQRMREMLDRARLIVMVSHDLESLRKLCSRVLWLDHGRVRDEGPAEEMIDAYSREMVQGTAAPEPVKIAA